MKRLLFIFFVLFTSTSQSHALRIKGISDLFDGNRKGLLIELGGGAHSSSLQMREGSNPSTVIMDSIYYGPAFSFKIGYAPNNRVELFYATNSTMFDAELGSRSRSFDNGHFALGFSFFLSSGLRENDWKPSAFISAGAGFGTLYETTYDYEYDDEEMEVLEGYGFFFGGGYEFAKHFRIEFTGITSNKSSETTNPELNTESITMILKLTAMAF